MWHHPAHHAKRTSHIISKDQCGKYASTTWDSSHVHLYHMHNPEANKWETQQPCPIHGQHGPPKKSVHANLFKKRLCTQTLLKKGPRATLDNPFFVQTKKKKKGGCNVLNQILYPNVNSQWWFPPQKEGNKSKYRVLTWALISDHICWHETDLSPKKNRDLEKLQIDILQKINNFAWQL